METVKQDMPPKGGFEKIIFERIPLKKYRPFSLKFGIFISLISYGWYQYYLYQRRQDHEITETYSAKLALVPLLTAECDRMRLRQYRKNRDEEAELMKNVEGWEVGTWMGERIYKTLDENEWYYPHSSEYFVHANPSDFACMKALHMKL